MRCVVPYACYAFTGGRLSSALPSSVQRCLRSRVSPLLIRQYAGSRSLVGMAKAMCTNRLVNERSPYLLQHAHNPVDWYPWGDEAFTKAKTLNRLIFLSVGYSTCHWCHVMAHESFENQTIADILNENFVSIKVDREERPDVDKLYMTFIQAISGGGGWPMSVFLTPDLNPVTGGTYFPPEDRYGRPGFASILRTIAEKWQLEGDQIRGQGFALANAIKKAFLTNRETVPADENVALTCYTELADRFDETYKGFGGAPKFPKPAELDFMLSFYANNKSTTEGKLALKMVGETLEAMARGGIHDHIGKGFHRYAVDAAWHVPHFEKMLYDQAQLLSVYANYSLVCGQMKEIVEDIADYVYRNLTHPEGGFYSAQDADSLPSHNAKAKREGAFYVWTEQEIDDALKDVTVNGDSSVDVATYFKQYFGVKANGNCPSDTDPHGELKLQNVLAMKDSHKDSARKLGISEDKLTAIIEKARQVLVEARAQRPEPHLDSKMLTSWNGLMISGLSRASVAAGKPELAGRAQKVVEFIKKYMLSENGELLRTAYTDESGGVVHNSKPVKAFADDYAFLIEGLLDLYEVTFDENLLKFASELQKQFDERFWDTDNNAGYFLSETDPSIMTRFMEDHDGAEPATNSVAALNLVRLASIFDEERFRDRVANILESVSLRLRRYPSVLPKMVTALMRHSRPATLVVVIGKRDDPLTQQMLDEIKRHFIPNQSLISLDATKDLWLIEQNDHFGTLLRSTTKPAVFICEHFKCNQPITSLDDLKSKLSSL
uniref:Spermatogenesis-associated protein 20-like TRX domain-containing protein n=1 Tax=Ascaris suum TaxID=6253 RepID=F1KWI2_ASCSU